jgi:hypothetical protein
MKEKEKEIITAKLERNRGKGWKEVDQVVVRHKNVVARVISMMKSEHGVS